MQFYFLKIYVCVYSGEQQSITHSAHGAHPPHPLPLPQPPTAVSATAPSAAEGSHPPSNAAGIASVESESPGATFSLLLCMYVRTVYMYISMYVCMYVFLYVCMHACIYICMYVYNICMCVYIKRTDSSYTTKI